MDGTLHGIEEGATLRTYLADCLSCHPKRVSKKFEGAIMSRYNGRKKFSRNSANIPFEEAQARREHLTELKKIFQLSRARYISLLVNKSYTSMGESSPTLAPTGAPNHGNMGPGGMDALQDATRHLHTMSPCGHTDASLIRMFSHNMARPQDGSGRTMSVRPTLATTADRMDQNSFGSFPHQNLLSSTAAIGGQQTARGNRMDSANDYYTSMLLDAEIQQRAARVRDLQSLLSGSGFLGGTISPGNNDSGIANNTPAPPLMMDSANASTLNPRLVQQHMYDSLLSSDQRNHPMMPQARGSQSGHLFGGFGGHLDSTMRQTQALFQQLQQDPTNRSHSKMRGQDPQAKRQRLI